MALKAPIFGTKNVLVTGGAGFIGSHLCEQLLKKHKLKVICIDDFSNSQSANIDYLVNDPNFEFIRHNVNEPFTLEQWPELEKFKVKFQGIQEIYHLACPTSAKNFDQFKIETLLANSSGMRNVLELAVKNHAKFLFASSSVVYGPRRSEDRIKESEEGVVNHLSPRGCYDEGKRFAETMVETYRQVYNLDVRTARIFRTYGPRLKLFDGQMISDFIVSALQNKDLVIYGDENFSSALLYVNDTVDALVKMMETSGPLSPINVGSDRLYKLSDVAEMVIRLTNSSSKIVFNPPLSFISPLGIPDLTLAKELLGWIPLIDLEQGIKKTIDFDVVRAKLAGAGI
ncbi:MAG: NAD-dependent epimerase/dehydratase family protein [Candidatus Magasanikbacteria bacterium GW2011_GWA2_45_39]|uniref:NAD-dependent epimerase/dehydratase family protein n=1 Tax=Candidatus Magasanikbacteria bacterium GW2011_GWA2_45_39 TaxID=1619041 RepID=A0A0G1MEG9_9BACT|nr:MAG: NAD-dependent epimerase/dehydratase family protein [Candidatus Magasanikbacteria bacterium GW2011_GWA2_45_39]HBW74409.1 NAD-dependent dehydratase [Candidatus Magasanikbacteria bacterium]